jgi:mannan endo-1,4-beta-mannosidase
VKKNNLFLWAGVLMIILLGFTACATASKPTATQASTMTQTITPSRTIAPEPTSTPTPKYFLAQRVQVVDYIALLSNAAAFRGTISGQIAGSADEIIDGTWYHGYRSMIEDLHTETGEWPGILGEEYEWGHSFTPAQLSDSNKVLIDYARAGGIIMVTLTPLNPWLHDESDIAATPGSWQGPESALSAVPAGAGLDDLLDTAKPVHAAWMRKLDRIAGALQELRDAGVVVLFRPMQEMNASWYWWGISSHLSDPGPYVRVYRAMHDYFTNEKGLDNLIWVYSPSSTHGEDTRSKRYRTVDWNYPGDDIVDIIAGTNYEDDMSIVDYTVYATMGKPLGIAEYGPVDVSGNWDTSQIIQRIRKDYPRIAFFVFMNSYPSSCWSLITNRNASILLADPFVINRDDLPWNVR